MRNKRDKKWLSYFMLALYVIFIHILCLRFFGEAFSSGYEGLLFIKSYNGSKYTLCIVETIVAYFLTMKHIRQQTLTDIVLVFLSYLYFIPGFVQQAATNSEWGYMLFFFTYYLGMEIWAKILKPHTYSNLSSFVCAKDKKRYMNVITIVCLIITSFLLVYNRTSFSVSSLIETLADVYGVREDAKLAGTHWLMLTVEYWAIYLIVLLVAYYSERHKWWITVILLVFGASLFLIQANRIFLFLILAALGMGLFRINSRKLQFAFCAIALMVFGELLIREEGLILTNIFRRYSVVPNRLGEFYYDYFLTEEPDWLRSVFDRIFGKLGVISPYKNNPIGSIISNTYFGWEANCNNGLVGGGLFCYGMAAAVVSTFGYVMTFRLFEGTISGVSNTQIPYALAFILASLAVNASAFLACMFSVTYFLFLYLSLIPLSRPYCKVARSNQHSSI